MGEEIDELKKEAEQEIADDIKRRKKEAIKYRLRAIMDMQKAIDRIGKEIEEIQSDPDWTSDEKGLYIGDVCGVLISLGSDPERRGKNK